MIGLADGSRESTQSWRQPLLDPQRRGLTHAPDPAIGDAALGFWNALREVVGATKEQRLRGFARHGKWRTMTFLAARRCDQLTAPCVTAPCVFDGPINGEGFRAYVNQQPVPTLEPDDIVIMDNPGGHKSKAVREAITYAGARLWFLPPYSTDLNPIQKRRIRVR